MKRRKNRRVGNSFSKALRNPVMTVTDTLSSESGTIVGAIAGIPITGTVKNFLTSLPSWAQNAAITAVGLFLMSNRSKFAKGLSFPMLVDAAPSLVNDILQLAGQSRLVPEVNINATIPGIVSGIQTNSRRTIQNLNGGNPGQQALLMNQPAFAAA